MHLIRESAALKDKRMYISTFCIRNTVFLQNCLRCGCLGRVSFPGCFYSEFTQARIVRQVKPLIMLQFLHRAVQPTHLHERYTLQLAINGLKHFVEPEWFCSDIKK